MADPTKRTIPQGRKPSDHDLTAEAEPRQGMEGHPAGGSGGASGLQPGGTLPSTGELGGLGSVAAVPSGKDGTHEAAGDTADDRQ
jgi:hypothetical protein